MNATKVNADPAESNGRLLLGIWRDSLHVTCGLTACTPGSAPGPTLGNEYGKTLSFYIHSFNPDPFAPTPTLSPRLTILTTRMSSKCFASTRKRTLNHTKFTSPDPTRQNCFVASRRAGRCELGTTVVPMHLALRYNAGDGRSLSICPFIAPRVHPHSHIRPANSQFLSVR